MAGDLTCNIFKLRASIAAAIEIINLENVNFNELSDLTEVTIDIGGMKSKFDFGAPVVEAFEAFIGILAAENLLDIEEGNGYKHEHQQALERFIRR